MMLPIVILALASLGICLVMLGFSYLFSPKGQESLAKKSDYECGLPPPKKTPSGVPVQFFLTAILFILFDIEIIFLYPFALAYREFLQTDYGLAVLLAMGFFLALFVFGLFWEIKTKALDWK